MYTSQSLRTHKVSTREDPHHVCTTSLLIDCAPAVTFRDGPHSNGWYLPKLPRPAGGIALANNETTSHGRSPEPADLFHPLWPLARPILSQKICAQFRYEGLQSFGPGALPCIQLLFVMKDHIDLGTQGIWAKSARSTADEEFDTRDECRGKHKSL